MTRISDIDKEEGGRLKIVSIRATTKDPTDKISKYIRKMACGDKPPSGRGRTSWDHRGTTSPCWDIVADIKKCY